MPAPYEAFKIMLDVPASAPALGFDQYASALARVIQHSEPRFAIGVFGNWGSGKTTLMNLIEAQLPDPDTVCVRFSAWRYEREEHLIVPLLDTIRQSIIEWSAKKTPEIAKVAKVTASTVGKAIRSLLAGFSFKVGVPGALDVSFDANKALLRESELTAADQDATVSKSFYHASFRGLRDAFEHLFKEGKVSRIVVFVDDLDRCLPQGALQVLESMKLFFDLEGFVFLVGLDRRAVEASIDSRYVPAWQQPPAANAAARAAAGSGAATSVAAAGESSGEAAAGGYRVRGSEYIKKIFQIPFSLPPVAITQITQFLDSMIGASNVSPAQADDLRLVVRPHLTYLVTEHGVNPRELKRFVNAYTLQMMIKPHLLPDAVLAFQTMSFRPDWEDALVALFGWRNVFVEAVRNAHADPNATLADLDPTLGNVPPSFLEYVSPGAPGHALLTVGNLDEYIYAGEATGSTLPPVFLDAITKVVRLRQELRTTDWVAAVAAPPPAAKRQEVQVLTKQAESFVRSLGGSPVVQQAVRYLEALGQQVTTVQIDTADKAQSWVKEQTAVVDEVLRRLREVYRMGRISGGFEER